MNGEAEVCRATPFRPPRAPALLARCRRTVVQLWEVPGGTFPPLNPLAMQR